ncbi:hypothetical protein K438DRAFT_1993637 [Mycena galopus ATCC 62051]|nr:hypothetical protein K438DRAFT_1993637 [Mycena galopus ATCC 62051]
MQILNEASAGGLASRPPPSGSVSYRIDETERGRPSSRSSSSFSISSSIATPTRARIPGPSNPYYPYHQASQYSLPANPDTFSGSHLGRGPFLGALVPPRISVDMTCAYPDISHTADRKVHRHAPSPFSASGPANPGNPGVYCSPEIVFEPIRKLEVSQFWSESPNHHSILSGGQPFIPPHRVHDEARQVEFEACEHTLMLQQTVVGAIPASGLAHCVACELASNLWLCLTCGSLGCGRRWPVGGGNGHALNHFEDTGHPVSVKLGTITPEGGEDVR